MKKILTFLLLISTIQVLNAQENSIKSYVQTQDSIFQHLDKSKITTGSLYDRVYQWADIPTFRSQDTFNFSYTMQVWHELYLSSYDQKSFLSASQVRKKGNGSGLDDKGIRIGYIDFKYNKIDSNAIANGSLVFGLDSLLYDGEGETSAYLEQQITLPIIFADKLEGDFVRFYFDPSLTLKNGVRRTLTSIKMETSAGESILLNPGESQELSIQGIMDSLIVIGVQMNFDVGPAELGNIFLGNMNIVPMNSVTTDICNSGVNPIAIWSGNNLKFQGYDESFPSQGRGDYKIYYHLQDLAGTNCDKRLLKPIIIMDGFDPQNEERRYPDDIWELLSYSNKHLGDSLRLKGYDVIVLNFPNYNTLETGVIRDGGADYIERNAMVLIKLIQQVNDSLQHNGSSEKLVIIGPSMGGQISRYALKYMENNSMNHNTRLFVAFDSPNLGANIPLGLQGAIWFGAYINNDEFSLDKYTNSIRSIAARQMLIHQIRDSLIYIPLLFDTLLMHYPLTTPDVFRSNWQNSINNLGFPNNLRKIALINGNTGGMWQNYCADMLHYKVTKASWPQQGSTLAEIRVKNLPSNGSSCNVFYGFIKQTGEATLSYSGNIYGNIDATAGSFYNTNQLVKDNLRTGHFFVKNWPFWPFQVNGVGAINNFSGNYNTFIPSVSALGFNNPNFNWANDIGNRNLVCNNEIPFDNYFTAKTNEEHVHVSEAAAKWIMEEIDKGQAGCPSICNTMLEIPGTHCLNSNFTIAVNGPLPTGVTLAWEYNTSVLQKISQTATSATFKVIGSIVSSEVKITLQNPCGSNKVFVKKISLGTPEITQTIIDASVAHGTKRFSVSPGSDSPYDYSWSNDGSNYFTTSPKYLSSSYIPVQGQYLWLKIGTSMHGNSNHKTGPRNGSSSMSLFR